MNDSTPDRNYWRSLEQLAGSDEYRRFAEAEFPAEADQSADAVSRRRFLQLMGASVALAGLTGCRWPQEKIVPFAARPEGVTPGTTRRFATSMELAGAVSPLLVTSYDGRPIKVEGNPDHPLSRGAANLFAQAGLLELYDPDRSRKPRRREGGAAADRGWDEALAGIAGRFEDARADRGRGLAVLTESSSSPTTARLRARLRRELPEVFWCEYEPLSRDEEREGLRAACGRPLLPRPRLADARTIFCLDADLLGDHPAALRNARDFAEGRRAEQGWMNRLYAVESTFSLTGAMADHRWAAAWSAMPRLALHLAACLFVECGVVLPQGAAALRPLLETAAHDPGRPDWLPAAARDLAAHRGRCLIAAGARQPAWVHALVHLCNDALGNVGRTVDYAEDPDAGRPAHAEALADLAARLRDGRVETLLVLGGNPAYDAPADLDFAGALAAAPFSARLGAYDDETSRHCRWHLPRAHFLESWADVRDADGRYGVTQPLIAPLHGGLTPAEALGLLLDGERRSAHDLVRETARGLLGDGPGFAGAWRRLLHDGFAVVGEDLGVVPALAGRSLTAAVREGAAAAAPGLGPDSLEIVFTPDPSLLDGRFANNAWLQELPDAMTKLAWDNAALVAPATADALGLAHGDVVTLTLDGRTLEAPVYLLPGQAPWSVALSLGHGRSAAGKVGNGTGCDAYRLRTTAAFAGATALGVTRTGRRRELATTQDHFAMDKVGDREREARSRTLVMEGDLAEWRRDPGFAEHRQHHPELKSLWKERDYAGHKWGMTVDLNSCIGCNACIVACQAENNIPVVGKKQVNEGREMHWLRLDRYFQGDPAEPRVVQQPVACVHCELAPCEQVCPVGATMHSEEGLNMMAYNRCVGTRYCSNNCPYKVRRFNFFNYNKDPDPLRDLMHNPEVTLRARGVMEKCTYCVQRIESAKIAAKNEGRPLRDGEITTACQQTCPTQAIVFGDLNDPDSRVAGLRADDRAYAMLAEMNLKPRTAYLARLRNPNPELAETSGHEAGHAAH